MGCKGVYITRTCLHDGEDSEETDLTGQMHRLIRDISGRKRHILCFLMVRLNWFANRMSVVYLKTLGAWDGLHYFIVALQLPKHSINYFSLRL